MKRSHKAGIIAILCMILGYIWGFSHLDLISQIFWTVMFPALTWLIFWLFRKDS